MTDSPPPDRFTDTEAQVRQFLEALFPPQQWDVLERMTAPEVVSIAPHGATLGWDRFRQMCEDAARAIDGLTGECQYVLADEERAAARVMVQGTHRRHFRGVKASNRRLRLPMTFVFEFRDGQIMSIEIYYDAQLLLSEIGSGSAMSLR